jgi:hypothetical protein
MFANSGRAVVMSTLLCNIGEAHATYFALAVVESSKCIGVAAEYS